MFGFGKPKPDSLRGRMAAAEASVRHGHLVWDRADLEERTALLRIAIEIQDDRLFLAYVHAPWAQIPDNVRLKLTRAVMTREDTAALNKRTASLEALGKRAGQAVAQCYSVEQFAEFFGHSLFATNWTVDEALGVWFALGRFCLLVSAGALEGIGKTDLDMLILSGEDALAFAWKMRPATLQQFNDFNSTKLKFAYAIYGSVNNSEALRRFFTLFVSEILGKATSFSPDEFSRGFLAQILNGPELDWDPALETELSSMFAKLKRTLQILISAQLAEIQTNFASALRPK